MQLFPIQSFIKGLFEKKGVESRIADQALTKLHNAYLDPAGRIIRRPGYGYWSDLLDDGSVPYQSIPDVSGKTGFGKRIQALKYWVDVGGNKYLFVACDGKIYTLVYENSLKQWACLNPSGNIDLANKISHIDISSYYDIVFFNDHRNKVLVYNSQNYTGQGFSTAYSRFAFFEGDKLYIRSFSTYDAMYHDPFTINGGSTGSKQFRVSGDQRSYVAVGDKVIVEGSTGNDGTYEVNTVAYGAPNTTITVNETPASGTFDGTLKSPYRIKIENDALKIEGKAIYDSLVDVDFIGAGDVITDPADLKLGYCLRVGNASTGYYHIVLENGLNQRATDKCYLIKFNDRMIAQDWIGLDMDAVGHVLSITNDDSYVYIWCEDEVFHRIELNTFADTPVSISNDTLRAISDGTNKFYSLGNDDDYLFLQCKGPSGAETSNHYSKFPANDISGAASLGALFNPYAATCCFSHTDGHLYIAAYAGTTYKLFKVNETTNSVVTSITVSDAFLDIKIAGGYLYGVGRQANKLCKIDLTSFTEVGSCSVTNGGINMCWNTVTPDAGGGLIVVNGINNTVALCGTTPSVSVYATVATSYSPLYEVIYIGTIAGVGNACMFRSADSVICAGYASGGSFYVRYEKNISGKTPKAIFNYSYGPDTNLSYFHVAWNDDSTSKIYFDRAYHAGAETDYTISSQIEISGRVAEGKIRGFQKLLYVQSYETSPGNKFFQVIGKDDNVLKGEILEKNGSSIQAGGWSANFYRYYILFGTDLKYYSLAFQYCYDKAGTYPSLDKHISIMPYLTDAGISNVFNIFAFNGELYYGINYNAGFIKRNISADTYVAQSYSTSAQKWKINSDPSNRFFLRGDPTVTGYDALFRVGFDYDYTAAGTVYENLSSFLTFKSNLFFFLYKQISSILSTTPEDRIQYLGTPKMPSVQVLPKNPAGTFVASTKYRYQVAFVFYDGRTTMLSLESEEVIVPDTATSPAKIKIKITGLNLKSIRDYNIYQTTDVYKIQLYRKCYPVGGSAWTEPFLLAELEKDVNGDWYYQPSSPPFAAETYEDWTDSIAYNPFTTANAVVYPVNHFAVHKSRMVLINDLSDENSNLILFSAQDYADAVPSTNERSIESGDGDALFAAVSMRDYLYLFKERHIYAILGDASDGQLLDINKTVGCKYKNSIVQYNNTVYFLSDFGIYSLRDYQCPEISNNRVANYFDKKRNDCIDFDNLDDNVFAFVDEDAKEILWFVPQKVEGAAQTRNNLVIIYNIEFDYFRTYSYYNDIFCSERYRDIISGELKVLLSDYDGNVLELSMNKNDDGHRIKYIIKTKNINMGTDLFCKMFRLIKVAGKNLYDVRVSYCIDDKYFEGDYITTNDFGSAISILVNIWSEGKAKSISVEISGNALNEAPFELEEILVGYDKLSGVL
jgi:hypothetical protein